MKFPSLHVILKSNKSYESIHKWRKRDSVQAQVIFHGFFRVFLYKIVEHILCSKNNCHAKGLEKYVTCMYMLKKQPFVMYGICFGN